MSGDVDAPSPGCARAYQAIVLFLRTLRVVPQGNTQQTARRRPHRFHAHHDEPHQTYRSAKRSTRRHRGWAANGSGVSAQIIRELFLCFTLVAAHDLLYARRQALRILLFCAHLVRRVCCFYNALISRKTGSSKVQVRKKKKKKWPRKHLDKPVDNHIE